MREGKTILLIIVSLLLISTDIQAGGEPETKYIWTLVSGSETINQNGVYNYNIEEGQLNKNIPGSRAGCSRFVDKFDNIWIFGGYGIDSNGKKGILNDLWKYDGSKWIWISGSSSILQKGNYGVKGILNIENIPGARQGSAFWINNQGIIYLFGGVGLDSTGKIGFLNDLWKYDGRYWVWVSGSSVTGKWNANNPTNHFNDPEGRDGCFHWIDKDDNLWIYGGSTIIDPSSVVDSYYSDLWKYDGNKWSCIIYKDIDYKANYGIQGVSDAINCPGGRTSGVSWIDSKGNLILFGGYRGGILNDLWKFDGTTWIWISGDKEVKQAGVYSKIGEASIEGRPGARIETTGWIDPNDNLWLFGGSGIDAYGKQGYLNDLWRYDGRKWTWIAGNNKIYNEAYNAVNDTSTNPKYRTDSALVIDSKGVIWIFGGYGPTDDQRLIDQKIFGGLYNDLWKCKLVP